MADKILIIDDEENLALFLKRKLELNGQFEVETASNGKEGLKKAAKISPDLILVDIDMPKMNGFEVLKNLKENKKTTGIPVVMLTGFDDEDLKARAASLYNEGYITKPVEVKELAIKIEEVIGRYRGQL